MKLAPLCLLLIGSVCSCLPQARTNELVPVVRSSTQTGQAVTVRTSGGSDQSNKDALGVTSSDFKGALEESLVKSGLFSSIGEGGYQLDTQILKIRHPSEAAVFAVITEIEVAYTLRKGGSVVWEKPISTSHRIEPNDALLGEYRDRIAIEGAVRENIRLAISSMSERLR